ncbi:tRNA (adenine(37)-N6)-methyltransferase isoform X2 [Ambystoma mexicanum]
MGLDQFSHVWVLFVFHQNGHMSCKAKVQPPRLNGAKTGVFSTRSPHRPNAIGLTLAKLEKVEGGTIYLSGIDMIQGTPVLDIKPYIADYDSPHHASLPSNELSVQEEQSETGSQAVEGATVGWGDLGPVLCKKELIHPGARGGLESPERITFEESKSMCRSHTAPVRETSTPDGNDSKLALAPEASNNQHSLLSMPAVNQDLLLAKVLSESTASSGNTNRQSFLPEKSMETKQTQENIWKENRGCSGSSVPSWVSNSPVTTLQVRFTPHSEKELRMFKAANETDAEKTPLNYFQSPEEVKRAIITLLSADPRSVYRRKHCEDRLYYFTLDTVHMTCWFGKSFAEVIRIQPVDPSQPVSSD